MPFLAQHIPMSLLVSCFDTAFTILVPYLFFIQSESCNCTAWEGEECNRITTTFPDNNLSLSLAHTHPLLSDLEKLPPLKTCVPKGTGTHESQDGNQILLPARISAPKAPPPLPAEYLLPTLHMVPGPHLPVKFWELSKLRKEKQQTTETRGFFPLAPLPGFPRGLALYGSA